MTAANVPAGETRQVFPPTVLRSLYGGRSSSLEGVSFVRASCSLHAKQDLGAATAALAQRRKHCRQTGERGDLDVVEPHDRQLVANA
jgi:hypothetical protein